jgi:hypothetical protein
MDGPQSTAYAGPQPNLLDSLQVATSLLSGTLLTPSRRNTFPLFGVNLVCNAQHVINRSIPAEGFMADIKTPTELRLYSDLPIS